MSAKTLQALEVAHLNYREARTVLNSALDDVKVAQASGSAVREASAHAWRKVAEMELCRTFNLRTLAAKAHEKSERAARRRRGERVITIRDCIRDNY